MTFRATPLTTPPPARQQHLTQQRKVETGSYLAQRTILRTSDHPRQHKCRITDCSLAGYSAVILSPFPDAARHFEIGQELHLEHADGWERIVTVHATEGNKLELRILNPVTKVILPNGETGIPNCHECALLGTHGELYRVTFEEEPELFGAFQLELPTGETVKVQVRWARHGEICLQPVTPYRRL
ncbi:hypothetical protein [Acidocella sp.]|uniref:hypothetical protein n=1 Tax=Acidocella sp. TaxID=50710 RepID=UPI003CFECFBE